MEVSFILSLSIHRVPSICQALCSVLVTEKRTHQKQQDKSYLGALLLEGQTDKKTLWNTTMQGSAHFLLFRAKCKYCRLYGNCSVEAGQEDRQQARKAVAGFPEVWWEARSGLQGGLDLVGSGRPC